jgi:hypothetical protein
MNGSPLQLVEWRNMNWSIDADEDQGSSQHHGLVRLFDWKIQFYDLIPTNNEMSKEIEDIKLKIEANKKWQNRIKKRSVAYF